VTERKPPWDSHDQREIQAMIDWVVAKLTEADLYNEEHRSGGRALTPGPPVDALEQARQGNLTPLRQALPGVRVTPIRKRERNPFRRDDSLADAVDIVWSIYALWRQFYRGRKKRTTAPSAFECASTYLGGDISPERIERAWRDRTLQV
jgi:hypothetical protein